MRATVLEIRAAHARGETIYATAARLGISLRKVRSFRAMAGLGAPVDGGEKPRVDVERCPVCHLTLPHFECVKGDALDRRER